MKPSVPSTMHKHGVDFEEVYWLQWDSALVVQDTRNDYGELRMRAKGFIQERLHELVFTVRGGSIRIIGLRKANRREVCEYEQKTQAH